MKINKIMNRSGLVVTCLAGVILTGCATHPGGKTDPQAWITQCNLTPKEQQCLLTVKKKYDAMTTAQQHNVITWFKDHYKRQSMWKRAGKKSCPSMTQQHLSRIYSKVDQCAKTRKHDFLMSSDHGRARDPGPGTTLAKLQRLMWGSGANATRIDEPGATLEPEQKAKISPNDYYDERVDTNGNKYTKADLARFLIAHSLGAKSVVPDAEHKLFLEWNRDRPGFTCGDRCSDPGGTRGDIESQYQWRVTDTFAKQGKGDKKSEDIGAGSNANTRGRAQENDANKSRNQQRWKKTFRKRYMKRQSQPGFQALPEWKQKKIRKKIRQRMKKMVDHHP